VDALSKYIPKKTTALRWHHRFVEGNIWHDDKLNAFAIMLAKIANVNVEVAYSRQIHKLDNSASIEVPERMLKPALLPRRKQPMRAAGARSRMILVLNPALAGNLPEIETKTAHESGVPSQKLADIRIFAMEMPEL